VNRTVSMSRRYLGGALRAVTRGADQADPADVELQATAGAAVERYHVAMRGLHFDEALAAVMELTAAANGYAESQAPWSLDKRGESERLATVLAVMGEACRILGHLMAPFTPASARALHAQLGVPASYDERGAGGPGLDSLLAWGGAESGERGSGQPEPLFPRVELPEGAGAAT
jgi:methionyl-tRNA synthetase